MMHVAETGRGRPLIFLHGWSSHGDYFGPQIATLARTFQLVMPDLPGHRHSPARPDALSIPALAADLHKLIITRGLERPLLIGWSMGAMVALDYISQFGSAGLAGLVIEDMTVKITNESGWRFASLRH